MHFQRNSEAQKRPLMAGPAEQFRIRQWPRCPPSPGPGLVRLRVCAYEQVRWLQPWPRKGIWVLPTTNVGYGLISSQPRSRGGSQSPGHEITPLQRQIRACSQCHTMQASKRWFTSVQQIETLHQTCICRLDLNTLGDVKGASCLLQASVITAQNVCIKPGKMVTCCITTKGLSILSQPWSSVKGQTAWCETSDLLPYFLVLHIFR